MNTGHHANTSRPAHTAGGKRRRGWRGLGLLLWTAAAVADPANPLTGYYYGTATIIEPASLGTIDLAFYLDVTGSAIQNGTSFIDLEKTLVFPAVPPQIGGQDVGPRVSGTLSAASFNLTSDSFERSRRLP